MLLIHARNVTGLGASQVVLSLIRGMMRHHHLNMVFVPPHQGKFGLLKNDVMKIFFVQSKIPNSLFRLIECLLPKAFYPPCEKALILGDIPLRGIKNQVVLVHQSNLIKPSVNPYSSKSITFKVMRKLFEWNLKDVKYFIVQSGIMKDELIQSYPKLAGKVKVISQPAPVWFEKRERKVLASKSGMTFFYPAAGYPHKNHKFIQKLDKKGIFKAYVHEMIVTLNDSELQYSFASNSKIKNVGRLSPQQCIDYYSQVDALFFPSIAESYGLPLVEAMIAGLPILCADLPYAHWMCDDEAIYFNPTDVNSAFLAIQELKKRLAVNWKPDWRLSLAKLPENWDEVADEFIELLK